uniref:Axin 2 n=1 Tax=Tetraodon nigroviridis TaxID=99883 RepID=H3CG77_TETNG
AAGAMSRALAEHAGASFREDAPRPPVPGEEGEAPRCNPGRAARMRGQSRAKDSPPGSRRRNEDGLGEPEGSASPDWPLGRWTKSLHFLLGDQDGARLFRTFLERDDRADTLDFWFACNGFRQMDLKDAKTLRVAKAIFKRYVDSKSVVSRQLKPATKTFIRDSVKRQQIDSAMFDQAHEVQSHMEEEAYQTFLTSDIYLDYVRTGCENAAYVSQPLGGLKLMCGYLPPLLEEEEWSCGDLKAKSLGAVVGLSAKSLRASAAVRTAAEVLETGCSSRSRREPCSPYLLSSGYVLAPASSANDSELSSDLTDDSTSMTDSSADGIPPYRVGTKKQLQREMHRSVKINGQITLPHFPRTHRLPKEMTPVEPSAFAAQLIARLETLQREDSMSSLEERLQQMQEEEEREESAELLGSSLQNPLLCAASQGEEDPQAILDEHLSRVLKTPGCQSPGASRRSPRSGSPDRPRPLGPPLGAYHRASTKHIHHHHIHHHHAAPRSREQLEAEAAQRVQRLCPPAGVARPDLSPAPASPSFSQARRSVTAGGEGLSSPRLPLDAAQRSQNVWQWILESERQGKHKPHSAQGLKKPGPLEPSRTHPPWGGAAALRGHHPGHPFLQDPAMPPLPPPNTLAQLEEACRRLEEVSKPPKQRTHQGVCEPVSGLSRSSGSLLLTELLRSLCSPPGRRPPPTARKAAPSFAVRSKELVVTYFFCGEEIPYRSVMKTQGLTLGLFKDQLSKKGNYRYYFKKASDEFECGAVFQEVREDAAVLPVYEGKVLGKVERVE